VFKDGTARPFSIFDSMLSEHSAFSAGSRSRNPLVMRVCRNAEDDPGT
jgi:hypothetical protein